MPDSRWPPPSHTKPSGSEPGSVSGRTDWASEGALMACRLWAPPPIDVTRGTSGCFKRLLVCMVRRLGGADSGGLGSQIPAWSSRRHLFDHDLARVELAQTAEHSHKPIRRLLLDPFPDHCKARKCALQHNAVRYQIRRFTDAQLPSRPRPRRIKAHRVGLSPARDKVLGLGDFIPLRVRARAHLPTAVMTLPCQRARLRGGGHPQVPC